MSKKKLDEAQYKTVPARKPVFVKDSPTFVDGSPKTREDVRKSIDFYYGIGGHIVQEGAGAFAHKVEKGSGAKEYYVKFSTGGSNVGRMLNPWGPFYRDGDELRVDRQRGRKAYEFQKVSETIFETYLKFLETRSERYILQAEREVGNG